MGDQTLKRIAIIGGGISGLACAYELEKARQAGAAIDWHLYEASDRLGGIVETTVLDGFVLEGGPDGWVSDKPWARDLAIELGLESELIYSNDATRKTYILRDGRLEAIPDGMRMMVPTDLTALETSPLFSAEAKRAYAAEVERADEFKASAPDHDESVADFVRRHFGDEVLTTLAAPLLSGVFGGDVHKLSVQSVMMPFVEMERAHGSLILTLRAKAKKGAAQPIFTSLLHGMGSLTNAILSRLPADRLHTSNRVVHLTRDPNWQLDVRTRADSTESAPFDTVILCASLDSARELLSAAGVHLDISEQLPTEASSAVLAAFTWPEELARQFAVPPGFGFLVPPDGNPDSLLACTFVDQKFPHRAPDGARVIRAFFGGAAADKLSRATDAAVATAALAQLRAILGPMPEPASYDIRRWPRSLPQYEVGHLDRMGRLDELLAQIPGLHLLGNSYRGVGLPDLIRDARAAARTIFSQLA